MSLIQKAKEHLESVKDILEDERLSNSERRELTKYIKETFQKKRALTEWNLHVRAVASENKDLPLKDVTKLARKTYVKQSASTD